MITSIFFGISITLALVGAFATFRLITDTNKLLDEL